MRKRNVLIIDGGMDYTRLFMRLGFNVIDGTKENEPIHLICFTGGADVSPDLYGAKKHNTTFATPARDTYEQRVFVAAVVKKVPMVGICRGGQFLNVMNGGQMYQDVEKHTRPHTITDLQTGEEVFVSSTHHQMMKPSPEALLVASSTLGGAREWFEGEVFKKDISNQDIEVLYYEGTNCLCFQPHPEFTGEAYEGMFKYFEKLLNNYLFAEVETPVRHFDCAC